MNKIIRITGTVKIFLLFLLILGRSYTSYSTTVQGVDVFNKVGHYKVIMAGFNYVQTPGSTVVAAYSGGMTESFAGWYSFPKYPIPGTVDMTFNGSGNKSFAVTKSIVLPHAPGMVSDAFMYYADITSYVQENGSGSYRNNSLQTVVSGKMMIVIEENPDFPIANVILNDYFYSNQDDLPETSYFTINLPSGMKVSSDVESQFQSFGGSIDRKDIFRGSVQQESAGNVLSPYQLLLNKTTNDYNKFFGSGSITNATYSALKNVDTLKYKIDAVGGYDGTEVASWAYMYTPVVTPETKKTVSDENKNNVAEKGEIITYKAIFTNSTKEDISNLIVRDSLLMNLPEGVTLISQPTITGGSSISEIAGKPGEYNLDILRGNSSITMEYQLRMPTDNAQYEKLGSNIFNAISANDEIPDSSMCDKISVGCATMQTNSKIIPIKSVIDSNKNGVVEIGEELTYTITLDNTTGTGDSVSLSVKDSLLSSLPKGITLSSAPVASAGTLTTNAVGDYTLDKVAKGTLTTITYKLQVTSDAAEYKALGSNVVNAVTSDGSTPAVPTDNNDPCVKAGTCTVTPTNPNLNPIKTLDDESIKKDGFAQKSETLTYKVVLTNPSATNNAVNTIFKDSLLMNLPKGVLVTEPTVSSGTIIKKSEGEYIIDEIVAGSSVTIVYLITLPKSSAEFKALGKYIVNSITSDGTDPVQPTDPTNPNEPCVKAKTCTVTPTSSGELTITKSASKSEVKVGDILGYTVTAINNSDSDVENAIIADMMPLGIVMIDGSSTYTLYASNGTVKEKGSITPTKNGSLMMYPFALIQPGEKVVIKYSTRIGAGVTVGGKYTNYAIGVTPTDDDPKTGDPFIDEIVNKIEATKAEQEKVISNTGTATVYVVEDKDFDNIPVIGKVFHDRDGDGYQDEAIARGVKVTLSGDNKNPVTIDTLGRTLVIKDITKPIYVGKIEGITTTSELSGEGNKVVLRRMVDPNNIGDITITTSEGTNVTLKSDGTTVSNNKGKVLKGDSNQDIAISRKVLSNQEMEVDVETVKETKVISNIVSPVHFNSGKSEIKADYLAKLDETLKSLKGKENVRIVAVGYTDSQKLSSTSKYKNNNELSEDRARQVADYLAKELNLSPDSIETEGRGESNPVVPNVAGYGEATRANRRTEIEIRYDEVVESKVPAQKVKVKGYMEEITIKNLGLQEEGIPGVRLITPEGQIIETDQYGRYHIPRVENIGEKGRNVIVKVDSITLPKGSIFTTENPRVKWVTPYLINDFNFGVQFKEDGGAK